MRAWSRLHRRMARSGFRRESRYRMAMLAGLAANLTFGLIRASILAAAYRSSGGDLAGYDHVQLMTYVWLGQGLLGAVNLYGRSELADRIKSGDITSDLLRPAPVLSTQLAVDLGRAAFTFLPRGLPSIAAGAVVSGVALTRDPAGIALALPSCALAVAISYLLAYALACLGFWFVDTRGFTTTYMVLSTFLTGLMLPVALFPAWLASIAHATPFPSVVQAPVDVLSGRAQGTAALATVGTQLGWALAVGLLAHALFAAGRRRLEVAGG